MPGDTGSTTVVKSTIHNSVPLLGQAKSYELWKKEVLLWRKITEIKPEKVGITLALALPEECTFGKNIRSSVIENVASDKMETATGHQAVLDYLDKILGKDLAVDKFDRFKEFLNCKKAGDQSMDDFISTFDNKVSRLIAAGQKIDNSLVTFMMLANANLERMELSLIMSRLNFEKEGEATLYECAKKQMRQTLGTHITSTSGSESSGVNIKSEPAFMAQESQEAYATNSYGQYRGGFKSRGQFRGRGGPKKGTFVNNNGWKPNYENKTQGYSKSYGKTNPVGKDGKILTCKICASTMHFVRECPHKNENVNCTESVNETQEEFVLISNEQMKIDPDSKEMSRFTAEALNCAALDTCCTSSVAGEKWMKLYISGLPEKLKNQVKGPNKGIKKFQFGNLGVLESIGQYKIPVLIAGDLDELVVDVIKSDIPLLMSKADMVKRGMVLDLPENKVLFKWKNKTEELGITSAGHCILHLMKIGQEVLKIEEIFVTDLKTCSDVECKKALLKLHKQFGHRPKKCFVELLKSANVWNPKMDDMLNSIIDGCEGCILRKRSPDRPAVAMPMATEFNEKVAIDLKIWKGGYILYMIDMFTRYTQAAFLTRKLPEQVLDAIMEKWVANFGVPSAILNDNGGEFVNAELQALKSELNVVDITTGAESPWQNGLCEKNHHTMDNILERIEMDYSKLSVNAKLAWATMAKNSLMMVYGFSPFQLVFGKNPKLPNILTDGPPGWEESTVSEKLRMHLNALHKCRQKFIETESCSRIKRALRAKIRCADISLVPGDVVYYVREGQSKWNGPARVMFQDGKVIFLRHGGFVVKVSANRLKLAGTELADRVKISEEIGKERIGAEESLGQEVIVEEHVNNRESEICEEAEIEVETSNSEVDNAIIEESRTEKRRAEQELTPPKAAKQGRDDMIRCNDKIKIRQEDGLWSEATVLSRGGKATGKHAGFWNIEWEDTAEQDCINLKLVEYEKIPETIEEVHAVMVPKSRQKEPACLKAKEEELRKLKDFGTYTIVKDVGQPRISSTWVVCEKDGGAMKARLVARGYEEEGEVVSDSPTMNKSSLRIILTLAASKGWTLETTDIKSAFLQGDTINRLVCVKPPREAKLEKGYLWKLEKCLYGLKDASRQWNSRVDTALLKLGFEKSKLDPSVYCFKNRSKEIIGVVGVHVDDFIHAGTDSFNKYVIAPLMEEFKVGKNEKGSFMYTGFKITQDAEGIILDQNDYVEKNLEVLDIDPSRAREKNEPLTEGELTDLRKMVGGLNWVVRATRPDLSFDLIDLSTKFKSGKVEDLIRARKVLLNLKTGNCKVFFPKLDLASIKFVIYTDASFANINDGTGSVGGQLVFLVDKNHRAGLIDWHCGKVKRVVRSTLAAETLSLVDGLENGVYHRVLFSELSGKKPESYQLKAIIDNKSCVEALRSSSQIEDKRLRIEIGEVKEMIKSKIVNEVTWVEGSAQLADALTKKGASGLGIQEVIQKGMLFGRYM